MNSIMGALSAKKSEIERATPWKELEDSGRIERLREYTKQGLRDILKQQRETIHSMEKRIHDLECHKHNSKGEVIIEKRLGDNVHDFSDDRPAFQVTPSLMGGTIQEDSGTTFI